MLDLVLLPGMDGTGLLFSEFISEMGPAINPIILRYPKDRLLDYAQLQKYVQEQLPRDRPYAILGESFSGPITIALAADEPRNVKALILACSFAKNPQYVLALLKPIIHLLPNIKTSKLARWALLGPHSTPVLQSHLALVLKEIPLSLVQARLRAIAEVDVTNNLRQIKVPILYLCARHDRVVPESASKYIQHAAPQTQIVNIDGPHMLLQTQPAVAAKTVLRFMDKCLSK